MKPARTGVTILNYGDPTDTLACLRALEFSTDLDMDIVVVDNGPDDAAHARLRDAVGRRGTTIATGDNLGYAAGNNRGIELLLERDCDFVWILNPDAVPAPSTLEILLAHMREVPDCGIVGPRVVYPGTPRRIWSDGGVVDLKRSGATYHRSAGKIAPLGARPGPTEVDYVPGASLVVRRGLIEDIGLLPEEYFLYFEETDWCRRAAAAGWRVMVQRNAVMEHHKRSSGALPTPYYLYYLTRNRYFFARECLGIDGEEAWAEMEETFHAPYRARVAEKAPHWLDSFEELIEMAKQDARSGVMGRNDLITNYPAA